MQIFSANSDNPFIPHPIYHGPMVCCDVTPVTERNSPFGIKQEFQVVFESPLMRHGRSPFYLWSRRFTRYFGEKAHLGAFLREWFGRDLSSEEQQHFDTECLIGRQAQVDVIHEQGSDGKTYAAIGTIKPDVGGTPRQLSGEYVRVRDRTGQTKKAHQAFIPPHPNPKPRQALLSSINLTPQSWTLCNNLLACPAYIR